MAKITLNTDYEADEGPVQSSNRFCEMLMRLYMVVWWESERRTSVKLQTFMEFTHLISVFCLFLLVRHSQTKTNPVFRMFKIL